MFDLLIEWKTIKIKTMEQREVVKRFNDIMLCREFWWTQHDIAMMSEDFYDDTLLILSKETALKQRTQNMT